MAVIDLHSKEFDEATITKLELFEDYAKEWIPTFVMSNCTNLWIFDYFAGPGYGKNNVEGSPIRILRQVAAQIGNIFRRQTKINICFNEYDEGKHHLRFPRRRQDDADQEAAGRRFRRRKGRSARK